MDIWTVPMIIVVLIICLIGLASARKLHHANAGTNEQDSAIPQAVEEHPFTLNPIIWIILVAAFFIGLVIFYYATSSY
jgi:fatty acid desaturase